MILTEENRRTRRKTFPSAISTTINPVWTDEGANPGLLVKRLETDCLNHDTV
jgi:hypothetical protein